MGASGPGDWHVEALLWLDFGRRFDCCLLLLFDCVFFLLGFCFSAARGNACRFYDDCLFAHLRGGCCFLGVGDAVLHEAGYLLVEEALHFNCVFFLCDFLLQIDYCGGARGLQALLFVLLFQFLLSR